MFSSNYLTLYMLCTSYLSEALALLIPIYLAYEILKKEPGSSVSIVSGYGLDDRENEVRSPAESKGSFL
jgi:hypothetical protein